MHNELWSIALDGTGAHRVATVGDDARRSGFARRLGDGRAALLADDTGAIYPYVGPYAGPYGGGPAADGFRPLVASNVTLHDGLCAVTVGGAPAVVYTVTPFSATHTTLVRDNLAGGGAITVAVEADGTIANPAPWDDGAVLAVRKVRGAVTIEILDVTGARGREVVATVDPPYGAHAPARLPDGRIVFGAANPRDVTETAIGELFIVDRNGSARTTGLTGVVALTVAGDAIVYEVGGATGISDLSRTNLAGAPVNLTRTPAVAEHLARATSNHGAGLRGEEAARDQRLPHVLVERAPRHRLPARPRQPAERDLVAITADFNHARDGVDGLRRDRPQPCPFAVVEERAGPVEEQPAERAVRRLVARDAPQHRAEQRMALRARSPAAAAARTPRRRRMKMRNTSSAARPSGDRLRRSAARHASAS